MFFWGTIKDGSSIREHLDRAKANPLAKIDEEDLGVEIPKDVDCPFELVHVWAWFRELDETRLKAMEGINPITHTEITNWANGMDIVVTPFERRAIRAIDREYIIYNSKKG